MKRRRANTTCAEGDLGRIRSTIKEFEESHSVSIPLAGAAALGPAPKADSASTTRLAGDLRAETSRPLAVCARRDVSALVVVVTPLQIMIENAAGGEA